MKYTVEKISSKRSMIDFSKLSYSIYRNDPNWIPPMEDVLNNTLNVNSNPYFTNAGLDLFICYKSGVPISRGITVINPLHWAKYEDKTAFFGFFESYENQDACNFLFDHMSNHCIKKGAEYIEGPFNPNHYSELGVQLPPISSPPAFFETYNPPYYHKLLENAGLVESYKMHARVNYKIKDYLRERYGKPSMPTRTGEYTVRKANLFHISSDLEKIREVYNDAFNGNWHFLPVTKEEYNFSAKYLFFVTYPSLVIFVEKGDEPVGVLQCMLNINPLIKMFNGRMKWIDYPIYFHKRKFIKEIILYAVGIKKQYQGTKVAQLLVDALSYIGSKYKTLSTTWMSDDNIKAVKHAEYFGLEPYKWFSIYKKSL